MRPIDADKAIKIELYLLKKYYADLVSEYGIDTGNEMRNIAELINRILDDINTDTPKPFWEYGFAKE